MFPIIVRWTISEGKRDEAIAALKELAALAEEAEPDTWMCTIHTPDMTHHDWKPPEPDEVIFFSVLADVDAYQKHLDGPLFKEWADKYLPLFVTYMGKLAQQTEFLDRQTGFVREQMVTS